METVRNVAADFKRMNKRHFLSQSINLGLIVTSALMIWKALILLLGSESPIVVVLSGSMEPGFYRGDILFLRAPTAPLAVGDIVVFGTGGKDIPIVHRVIKLHESHAHDYESVERNIKAAGHAPTVGGLSGRSLLTPSGREHPGVGGEAIPGAPGGDGPPSGAGSSPPGSYLTSGSPRSAASPTTAPEHPRVAILTKGDNNWGDDRELYPPGWEWLGREHVVGRVFAYVPHVGRLTILLNDYPALKVALIGILGIFVLTSKE